MNIFLVNTHFFIAFFCLFWKHKVFSMTVWKCKLFKIVQQLPVSTGFIIIM